MRLSSKKGFTLVELLVVIGIIALLISILLPSLNKARSSASLLSCQSNFRQVYNALLFYAGDNKGFLPRAASGSIPQVQGVYAATYMDLSRRLGRPVPDELGTPISPVFTCTEAINPERSPTVWAPWLARTIKFNPRAMPGWDQEGTIAGQNGYAGLWPQRKLASVKKAQEKALAWEGPQLPGWNMTTEPEAIFTDNWRWGEYDWSGAHAFDEVRLLTLDPARANVSVNGGPNRDDGWWVCSVRYRHINQTRMPVLYFDGHVESKQYNKNADIDRRSDFKVREICINR
jgi:prepilin-type N-terminal cleavage/methylation domain-containing protein/prepilin-type processing-associated H-X9-DG protein